MTSKAVHVGVKIFATKGPLEIQAQTDALSLITDHGLTVVAALGYGDWIASFVGFLRASHARTYAD